MDQGGALEEQGMESFSVGMTTEQKEDEGICKKESDLSRENERLRCRIEELERLSHEGGERIDQVSVLTEQLAHERNENERLQENLSGLQESLVKSKQELLEFQQRVYDSEIISSRSQHESKILEHEKNALQESLRKYQEEAGKMEARVKELHASKNSVLLESTRKISSLEVSCRDFEHKIALMQKSRDELEMEYSKTCDELRRVKSELDFAKGHYEGKIKIKEEAIRLKEEQVQQVQALLDMSISTAQNLESEMEKLKSDMAEEARLQKEQTLGGFEEPERRTARLGGRQFTDSQALEALVGIFGEEYILGEASSGVEDALGRFSDEGVSGTGGTSGGRRILIDLLTQLEDYQQSMEELRHQNSTLKSELKECQYHLRVTVPDFELTREKYESLQAENNFAIQQVQSLTQERRALIHEISELKTLWQHESKKREIYEEQCKMITQNFSQIVNNADELQFDLETRHDMEDRVPDLVGSEKNNMTVDRSKAERMYSDVIEQNTQLKIQVSRLIEGIELDSQIQIRKLTSDIASYKDQFEKINSERDELVSQYQALISKLEEENTKLKQEIKDAAAESVHKRRGDGHDNTGTDNGTGGTAHLEKGLLGEGVIASQQIFVKQLGEVTEMCRTLSEKLTSEIESSTQCRSELSRYKAQCEYMESMGERNRKRLDELFEERDRLYMQVNDLRREQDGRDMELQELRDKINSKESEILDLKRENDHQRQSILSLNACISDLRSDIEQGIKQRSQDSALQRDMISQLQGELEGKCVEINSMRKSQDAILQREFEESQRLRQQLRTEHDRYLGLESKLKDLQTQRDDLEKRLVETERDAEVRRNSSSRPGSIRVFDPTTPPLDASETRRSSVRNSIAGEGSRDTDQQTANQDIEETEISELRVQLEESRKLQNYWKELVQSVEKQLEARTKDLEDLRRTEEGLRAELELRSEEVSRVEEENQRELARLNESVSAMTLRLSSVDEEVSKKEAALREALSQASEENVILKKEAEELRRMEQDLRGQYQNIVRMHSLDIERLQNASKQCLELKEELGSLRERSKKSEDESTSLVMEMQNDILHLRRQLESYIKKYEEARTDSQSLREILSRLKTEHQLPIGAESILETTGTSTSLGEGESEEKRDERRSSMQSASSSPQRGSSSSMNSSSSSASLLLMRKVQTLTSSVEELDAKLDESKIEIQRLTFERKSLREENEILQKRLTEELERASEFASRAEANETTLIRLGELVTLRESNDRLRRELIQATERHSSLEKQLEQESRQSDPLRCEISKLEAQVESLRSLCEEKSALSRSWEEQYNRVLLNYENINPGEVSQIKEEVSKLKALNEELREALGTKSQEIEKLHTEKQQEQHVSSEELQLTKQQMEQLRKVYMSTNQKLKEERNKCTRLENELKKLNSQPQPQTQGAPGGSSNPSGSQDGTGNPQGYKPTHQEIKSISQATENLVCTVLKLAKLSILRLEPENGMGANQQSEPAPPPSPPPPSVAPVPTIAAGATTKKVSAPIDNANNNKSSGILAEMTNDISAAGAFSNASKHAFSASAGSAVTASSNKMVDFSGVANSTMIFQNPPLIPPPPPPPPPLLPVPSQPQSQQQPQAYQIQESTTLGQDLVEMQASREESSVPLSTSSLDLLKYQRSLESSGDSSIVPAQKKRPVSEGNLEVRDTNTNNQQNGQEHP